MSFGAINLLGKTDWKNDLLSSVAMTAGKKITYTPAVTGNRRQWTVLFNFRRNRFGIHQYILANETGGDPLTIGFDNNNKFRFYSGGGAAGGEYVSTRVFRDTEHLSGAVMYDSVAGFVRVIINGEEINDWVTKVIPGANYQTAMNWTGARMAIGDYNNGAGTLEGPLSDLVILDGEVLSPQEVKAYRTQDIPFGNNVITTTKKFTTAGENTRWLNFANNVAGRSDPILNNENQYIEGNSVAWRSMYSDILPDIKFQMEISEYTDFASAFFGVSADGQHILDTHTASISGLATGVSFTATTYYATYEVSVTPVTHAAVWGSPAAQDVVSLYFDIPNRKMYMAVNGAYLTGHDPVAGTGGMDLTTGDLRLFLQTYQFTGAVLNLGQKDYAYPVDGYGPLQEPAKSDLKRCKLLPATTSAYAGPLVSRGLGVDNTANVFMHAYSNFSCSGQSIYIEMLSGSDIADVLFGFTNSVSDVRDYTLNSGYPRFSANAFGVYKTNATRFVYTVPAVAGVDLVDIPVANDVDMMAVNLTLGRYWTGVNGVWAEGDPVTGTGGISIPTTGDWWFFIQVYANRGHTVNFGDSPFLYKPTGFSGPAELDFDTLRRTGPTDIESVALTDIVDLTVTYTAAAFYGFNSDYYMKEGVYYAEATLNDTLQTMLGIFGPVARATGQNPQAASDWYGIYDGIASHYLVYTGGGTAVQSTDPTLIDQPDGTVIGMLLDLNVNRLFFRTPAGWYGDPVAGTGGIPLEANQVWAFAGILYQSNTTMNFGATAFTYTDQGVAYKKLDATTALHPEREYGPNGTQMLFEDSSALGKSTAGNLLPWTLTGITSSDQTDDTPGDPWAILSATRKNGGTISRGGLDLTPSGNTFNTTALTLPVLEDGCYVEFSAVSVTNAYIGLYNPKRTLVTGATGVSTLGEDANNDDVKYSLSSGILNRGAVTGSTIASMTSGQSGCMAYKNGSLWFGTITGSTITWVGDPAAGTGASYTGLEAGLHFAVCKYGASIISMNAGKVALQATPPTGFQLLRNSTKATPKYHGRDVFDAIAYVADGVAGRLVASAIEQDFSWFKNRLRATTNHVLIDRLRGPTVALSSNVNAAEIGYGGHAFTADGSTITDSGSTSYSNNTNGDSYVVWNWKAGGAAVANTDGSRSSQVSIAPEGHFGIVSDVGDGISGATIGHSMPGAPEAMFRKSRNGVTQPWHVYHEAMGNGKAMFLDTTSAQTTSAAYWNDTNPTSSVFTVGTSGGVNESGEDFITYLFRSVPGLCKVGSYKGNGSTDGPFIYLGQKTRWVLLKRMDSTSTWALYDTERDPDNVVRQELTAEVASAETTAGGDRLDITALGMKIRTTGAALNANGGTYIYVAMADVAGGGDLPAALAA